MLELARSTVEIRKRLSNKGSRYWVYCLELQGGTFYVGETDNVWLRLTDHILGLPSSAKWVKRNGFRRVLEIVRAADHDAELTKTLFYMSLYGWERVRGANFCATDLAGPPPPLEAFDRYAHAYDHLSQAEVAAVEADARKLAAEIEATDTAVANL